MAEANEEEQQEQESEITIEEGAAKETEERQPVAVTISDIELENLRNELQDYKNKYLRTLAESENTRKRLMKERQELIQYSLQNLVCDFLTPIDQLDNALKHADKMSNPEVKQWSIGFQMILSQFKDVLSNNNVQYFESLGKAFDPHQHEAVEMITSAEQPANIVIEECLKGYKMGDRVIRPARVKVTKKPAANCTENEADTQDEFNTI